MKKYKLIFCDLDDTLIQTISGETFPRGVYDMKIKFDVLDAIHEKFQMESSVIGIVTNQGGIESGKVDKRAFSNKINYVISAIHEYLDCQVTASVCPSNQNSSYRKPNTGMLEQIAIQRCVEKSKEDCIMIGDASGYEGQFSDSDKKTAENYGIDYIDVGDLLKDEWESLIVHPKL